MRTFKALNAKIKELQTKCPETAKNRDTIFKSIQDNIDNSYRQFEELIKDIQAHKKNFNRDIDSPNFDEVHDLICNQLMVPPDKKNKERAFQSSIKALIDELNTLEKDIGILLDEQKRLNQRDVDITELKNNIMSTLKKYEEDPKIIKRFFETLDNSVTSHKKLKLLYNVITDKNAVNTFELNRTFSLLSEAEFTALKTQQSHLINNRYARFIKQFTSPSEDTIDSYIYFCVLTVAVIMALLIVILFTSPVSLMFLAIVLDFFATPCVIIIATFLILITCIPISWALNLRVDSWIILMSTDDTANDDKIICLDKESYSAEKMYYLKNDALVSSLPDSTGSDRKTLIETITSIHNQHCCISTSNQTAGLY